MPLLSVLTPALTARATLLDQAGRSIAAQRLPAGWDVEWIVEEDGTEPALSQVMAAFPFARHRALGIRLGVAAARNLALSRAKGELVHVLDSDDLLLPEGLAVAIEAFQQWQEIQWVAGRADDLLPDDSRVSFEPLVPTGYLKPGVVSAYVREHGNTPVHPAGLTLRTAAVRALGGWAALPCAEDVALLVALAELLPGYHTPEVTWLYRRHPDQMMGAANWHDFEPACLNVVHQRLAALDQLDITMGV